MKKYLGVKLIEYAEEMSRQEYCDYREWSLPKDEDGEDRVYLVEYEPDKNNEPNHPAHEGYISMSPKDVFENAYRPIDGLTFGLAIEAMKLDKCVTRDGWNGQNMYIYLSNGYTVPTKDVREEKAKSYVDTGWVDFNSHIDMKTINNNICIGWSASQADMLAEDWKIIE